MYASICGWLRYPKTLPPQVREASVSHIHPVSSIHEPRHPTSRDSTMLLSQEVLTAVQCSSDNMPSPLSRFQPDASSHSSLALPALLFFASLVANVFRPTNNSLLTSAIAWLAVCASSTSKGSARSLLEATSARKTAWAAGLLFALAQVCDKAADGLAIWWAKVILHLGGFGNRT